MPGLVEIGPVVMDDKMKMCEMCELSVQVNSKLML